MKATDKAIEAKQTVETTADALADLSVAGAQAETTKGGTISSASIQVVMGDASVKNVR